MHKAIIINNINAYILYKDAGIPQTHIKKITKKIHKSKERDQNSTHKKCNWIQKRAIMNWGAKSLKGMQKTNS